MSAQDDPYDYGREELEEQDYQIASGSYAAFCWTESEYLDWRAGLVTEAELRAKHATTKED